MAVATEKEFNERTITKKVAEKADELGIEYKVQYSAKEDLKDIVVFIKRNTSIPNADSSDEEINQYLESNRTLNLFTDYLSDIILGKYAEQVKFRYPSTL